MTERPAARSSAKGEKNICGIIGYVGLRAARPLLLDGLTRLEYRGYDSAGVCFVADNGAEARLERGRVAGSVGELASSLNGTGADARCGIGHTRWATHGRVCVENAHPFLSSDASVAVALNGIVENFTRLRGDLCSRSHQFASETDAEVVCHLVAEHYRGDLVEAVSAAAAELQGHFAFVCCHRDHRELLVGFRRQCPLVVGRGTGETFLASSTTALPTEIRRLQLPNDEEVVAATPQHVRFYVDGRRRIRRQLPLAADRGCTERGEFESLMLKEIHDQPAALRQTIADFADSADVRRRHPSSSFRWRPSSSPDRLGSYPGRHQRTNEQGHHQKTDTPDAHGGNRTAPR
jgi:glutamine---fructose-6-phosphate transaminase (isomerizing)